MNTLQNLIDNGIGEYTANKMLADYKQRIGTMNGIYEVVDINYDFTVKGKDVTLKCSKCGNVIHRVIIQKRNKWPELIKSCPCQKEEKARQKELDFENREKIKRELILSRIGEIRGDYEIVFVEDLEGNPKYVMHCTACGAEKLASVREFERRKDFRCTKHFVQPVKYDESYIGRKKNFLTVRGITKFANGEKAFLCECDCGNMKLVKPTMWDIGRIKSCGCFAESLRLEHTEELDRLRRIHSGMIQRCYNPNSASYANYGGRGIIICDEWLNNRENFIEWALNNGYSNDLSIDRIDANGNYEPSNCRWATDEVQLENRRPRSEWRKPKPRKLKTWTIEGETKTIGEWCEQYDTSTVAIRYRIKTLGMTLEQALKTPKISKGRPRKCR